MNKDDEKHWAGSSVGRAPGKQTVIYCSPVKSEAEALISIGCVDNRYFGIPNLDVMSSILIPPVKI